MSTDIETFFNACAHGCAASVSKMLDSGIHVDIQEPDSSYTGLLHAVRTGNEAIVKLLIERGADVNLSHPLYHAAVLNRASVCTLLIYAKANMSFTDTTGDTALHVAAELGWIDVCIALLDGGANVYIQNNKRQSAIQIGVGSGGELEKLFLASQSAWMWSQKVIARACRK